MAARVKVQCIRKTNRQNHWERISHIGGQNADGTRWLLTEEKAIEGIETKKWDFFVEVPRNPPVDVIVAKTAQGRKYLKTVPDGDVPNNLLSLPDCPS
jgi:hypothetical protein